VSREQDDPAEGRDAMTRTVEEARLLADQRREDGWDALVVPAVDTAPVPSDAEEREWGFVHIVPDNYAGRVAAACETGSFPRYDIYRRRIGETVSFVTELLDPEHKTVLLVAGQYTTENATGLYHEATSEGTIRTMLQRLDGDRLARFEHEDVEKFFPDGMAARSGRQYYR
jgi:hypothetical protein